MRPHRNDHGSPPVKQKTHSSEWVGFFELLDFQTNATLHDLGKVPKSVAKRAGEGPEHRKAV
jgi:hypothetical protein